MNKNEIQALLYDCTDRSTGSVDYEAFLRGLANGGDLEAVKREMDEAVGLLKVSMNLAKLQQDLGGIFVFEHPFEEPRRAHSP